MDRTKVLAPRIAQLERYLLSTPTASSEAAAIPTHAEQARRMRALLAELRAAEGEVRRDLRTRIAQALRTALRQASFTRHTVEATFRGPRVA